MPLSFIRNTAKRALIELSRMDMFLSPYRQSRFLVLCYHGVVTRSRAEDRFGYHNSVTPKEFSSQLEYLGARYRFVGLDGLEAWSQGERTTKPPVLITFDDGYRNNLTLAAPVLRRYGAPALFFLTTSHIGTTDLLWTQETLLRILSGPGIVLDPLPGWPGGPLPADLAARRESALSITEALKKIPDPVRRQHLSALRTAMPLDSSLIDHELDDFLSWDEARELVRQGFEIGSHTETHPVLSRLASDALRQELAGSRQRLETELACPIRSIAFPNGSPEDYNPEVMEACRQNGYPFAFAVGERFHTAAGDLLAIQRVAVPGHSDPGIFRFRASGMHDMLSGSAA